MADVGTVVSLCLECVRALVDQYNKLRSTDSAANDIAKLVENLGYVLEEAREQGLFKAPSESIRRNLENVHRWLGELDAWTKQYINAGKKGKLARMRDYFCAGDNLEHLQRLSAGLDAALQGMDLALKMHMCAGIKAIIEEQRSLENRVSQFVVWTTVLVLRRACMDLEASL